MNEEEIFRLLREQEELLLKKPVYYVHYDGSSRKILNIRNYLDSSDPSPHIEMTENDFDF